MKERGAGTGYDVTNYGRDVNCGRLVVAVWILSLVVIFYNGIPLTQNGWDNQNKFFLKGMSQMSYKCNENTVRIFEILCLRVNICLK